MAIYRTLILAGVLALSANAAMARGDGKANERIRDEYFHEPQMQQQVPMPGEGRASTEGPAVWTYRHEHRGPTSTEAADY